MTAKKRKKKLGKIKAVNVSASSSKSTKARKINAVMRRLKKIRKQASKATPIIIKKTKQLTRSTPKPSNSQNYLDQIMFSLGKSFGFASKTIKKK
ncbi:MAG: hypothetical protein HQL27_00370 [Candidatus Omnitrophica bacterium]|nr:hypothetical protein [Candidatus Omnitrophota bacterium]